MTTTLLVRHDALGTTRLRTAQDAPLAPGQVRVRIAPFALTSNNITYAAFGDAMHYWDFFPSGEAGWGVVPVWGFATVAQSLHPGVAVGERLYGYFPMADQAVLQPARLTPEGFFDAAPHRAALHAVYNRYTRCNTDPCYTAPTEDLQALLRPLFMTAWLIDDFLQDNGFFGAATVLLSSASSKTASATAFQLAQRPGIEVVGLTSPGNKAFCESLGCYSRVLGYDELGKVPAEQPCVYVDFAGNADLRRDIHTRLPNLRYSSAIGGTHVEQLGGAKDLPGPRATLFFAPAQVKKRNDDWGAATLNARLLEAWQAYIARVADPAAPWLQPRHHRGPQAVQAAYLDVLGGRGDPRVGHMLSLV
ncbi:DUF2855 family protein [Pseudorhodoferax sp. Leaf267]|uniref:DUF2855 family protein n=1 Tax=Pseudorhodoferax sp. Leaf267 TaxID=1736316 RepID=UPI0006FF47D6|nr:DUF2855 family protein [Pseudorhodoferax sp. Leaf267]KQP19758.1 hypothetical protein ASF43_28400 [Pseudorhodoferax sp. Leaf267]